MIAVGGCSDGDIRYSLGITASQQGGRLDTLSVALLDQARHKARHSIGPTERLKAAQTKTLALVLIKKTINTEYVRQAIEPV